MRRLFGSVRARATLGATLVVAVVLVAAGLAVLQSLHANLLGQASSDAEARARRIASVVASGRAFDRLDLPDDDDEPVQIADDDGHVLAVSEDLEAVSGTGVAGVRVAPAPETKHEDSARDTRADADADADADEDGGVGDEAALSTGSATIDGHRAAYRWAGVEAERGGDDGESVTVYAGAPLDTEEGAVGTASTVMLIGLPVLLAVVATVTWLVTRRALRPVESIRREMAAITASQDLGRRVPEPGTHDEIAALARTTNETLSALESSVERQRRFVADASHELRSPIASLRTQLEVGAAHPELLDVDGAVADTVRLQQLAADLLLLARLDAGERPRDRPVDLVALVARELDQRAHGRVPVRLRASADAAEVLGSGSQLQRVLGNLLDNAQRHARSEVSVELNRRDMLSELAVCDDGAGVPPGQRERIFERFVRLDDARARDEGGAGLGLALARDLALRHGGTLTAGERPGGGARFVLRLPLSR
ncbi:HAMP domain-containing sensor histidine kinase [Streptomyces sp. NPDC049954]|uniref:sensor histidine kinase n=1 Tax=Streptomyces sp. NPDC049954 TaxID=3155779 RepID=UPI00343E3107